MVQTRRSVVISSSLALFGSEDKEYRGICKTWIDILVSAFETDGYSKDKLNSKSKESLGIDIDGSYIGLHGLNNLALYAFNADNIPIEIQKAYLKWLHSYDGVITYTNTRLDNLSKNAWSTRIISLLSKFIGFTDEFPDIIIS